MENKTTGRSFLPIVLTFVIISILILVIRPMLPGWQLGARVLLGGNVLLFLVTAASFYMYIKGLRNDNIQAFLRVMYGSLLVKLFVCLVAVFIYAAISHEGVSRSAIIGCFILYALYTFLEVRILLRLSKKSPNNA